jgi:AcrR family transcriptional regulator
MIRATVHRPVARADRSGRTALFVVMEISLDAAAPRVVRPGATVAVLRSGYGSMRGVATTVGRPVRRQARGERRMAEILDAALALFAEVGYEAASTNRIAARAGISPGSLYQFFSNKEAIAEALSARLATAMGAAHAAAFDGAAVTELPLDELLDRTLDPLIAFGLANPGAKALLAGPDAPAQLAMATRPLQEALLGRVAAVIGARAPGLPAAERERAALVAVQIVRAMTGAIAAAADVERAALVGELKRVLQGYLAPLEERAAGAR